MNLNPIRTNLTELEINGLTVLFSYRTPVAAIVDGVRYRTETRWSNTTSRHINQWLDGGHAQPKPQEFFDNLISGTKA